MKFNYVPGYIYSLSEDQLSKKKQNIVQFVVKLYKNSVHKHEVQLHLP